MSLTEIAILACENALDEMKHRRRRLLQQIESMQNESEDLDIDIAKMQEHISAAREKYLKGVV